MSGAEVGGAVVSGAEVSGVELGTIKSINLVSVPKQKIEITKTRPKIRSLLFEIIILEFDKDSN